MYSRGSMGAIRDLEAFVKGLTLLDIPREEESDCLSEIWYTVQYNPQTGNVEYQIVN